MLPSKKKHSRASLRGQGRKRERFNLTLACVHAVYLPYRLDFECHTRTAARSLSSLDVSGLWKHCIQPPLSVFRILVEISNRFKTKAASRKGYVLPDYIETTSPMEGNGRRAGEVGFIEGNRYHTSNTPDGQLHRDLGVMSPRKPWGGVVFDGFSSLTLSIGRT